MALMSDTARAYLVAHVSEDDFEEPSYKVAFMAIRSLMAEGRSVDLFTVYEEINRVYRSGCDTYLVSGAVDDLPNPESVGEFCRAILDASTRRKLFRLTSQFNNRLGEEDKIDEMSDSVASEIITISARLNAEDASIIGDVAEREVDAMSREMRSRIMFPWQLLNMDTGGMEGDQLVIIGARPGVGKTAAALQIAMNAADTQGQSVLFVSAEMSKQQIWRRVVHQELGISPIKQATGIMCVEERMAVAGLASKVKDERIGLYVMDSGDLSYASVFARAKAMHIIGRLGLVIVDYLQIMDTDASENRSLEIARLTKNLKRMSRQLQVPVIALSQLNRELERSDSNRPPRLTDLRESGAIEQDADLVLFIHRKPEGLESEITQSQILLAKQRMGPTSRYRATYSLDHGKFFNFVKTGG